MWHKAFKLSILVKTIIHRLHILPDPCIKCSTDHHFTFWHTKRVKVTHSPIRGFPGRAGRIKRCVVTCNFTESANKVIAHDINHIEKRHYVLPFYGLCKEFFKSTCSKADNFPLSQCISEFPDKAGKVLLIRRYKSMSRVTFDCRILPVKVDTVSIKIIEKLLCGSGELFTTCVGCKNRRTKFTAAPTSKGKQHFQTGICFFERYKFLDSGSVAGIID